MDSREIMKLTEIVKNIQNKTSVELDKSNISDKDKQFVESELNKIKASLSDEMAKFHKAFTK